MAGDVFISHVAEDGGIALRIALALEENGYRTWCYEADSVPGPSYLMQVSTAIGRAQVIVIVISGPALASRQVTRELVRALESDKHFIPILHDLSHEEFQSRQPEWNQLLGASTSIRIPSRGVEGVVPRLLEGLRALGVEPLAPAGRNRIEVIQGLLQQRSDADEESAKPFSPAAVAASPAPARRSAWQARALLALGLVVLIAWSGFNLWHVGSFERQGPMSDWASAKQTAVGVMEIRARGDVPDWMRDFTRDAFNTVLSKTPGIRVYSKQKIDFLCAKRGLTEIEAAETLHIHEMITGTVSLDATGLVLEVEVIETSTGVLRDSDRTSGRPDQLIDLQNRAAVKLIRALNVELSAEQVQQIFANRTDDTLDSYHMLAETMGSAVPGEPARKGTSEPGLKKGTFLRLGARLAYGDEASADEQAVRDLLEQYQAALEQKDVNHLAALQVSMDDDQRRALARYFGNARNLKVRFADVDLTIEGEEALATFTRTDSFEDMRSGKEVTLEIRINSQLVKGKGGWKVRGLMKPS